MNGPDHHSTFFLPAWIAGRFNGEEQIAIVFNNLLGETYLFEGQTAALWRELLRYDYLEPFNLGHICDGLNCTENDLLPFFSELLDKRIIIDHVFGEEELLRAKELVNETKSSFLYGSRGLGSFNSELESVDNDYRDRVARHGIPFSVTIELTYSCNEACIHCYNPNSPRGGGFEVLKPCPSGELDSTDYLLLLDSLAMMGVAKVVFTGGDPFMKKGIMSILSHAHKLKFAFSVYTNGLALYSNPELYEQLRDLFPQYIGLSIYSTVCEVHDGITRRKGSCKKTMEVAEKCYKDALGLQIKCPIMQANKDSYGSVFDFALHVNGMPQFDVNITSSVDGDSYASRKLRLNKEQLEEVLQDKRVPATFQNHLGIVERRPEMKFCGAGDSSFNIMPDGTVTPCSAFPFCCGSIKEQSIGAIWRDSEGLNQVRALRYKDSDICGKEEYCKYCIRCIGQSFIEHGVAANHSKDNCFLAKVRYEVAQKKILSSPE